jgi:hypothetical protein
MQPVTTTLLVRDSNGNTLYEREMHGIWTCPFTETTDNGYIIVTVERQEMDWEALNV